MSQQKNDTAATSYRDSIQVVLMEGSDETTSLLAAHGDPARSTSSSSSSQHYFSRSVSDQWTHYVGLVDRHPLLTKSVTATILMGLADLCAQGVEHVRHTTATTLSDSSNVDWPRVARFAAFGLLGAPWSHYYFGMLDHYLPPSSAPWTWTTFFKVLIDQFVQAPILLAIMICALSLMKGDGVAGAKGDMKDNFVHALIANWKLWLPASAINLAFVAPSMRVLYVNVVFLFWTIILSLLLNA